MRVGSLVEMTNDRKSFKAILMVTDDSRWDSEGSFKAVTVITEGDSFYCSVGDCEEYGTWDSAFQFTELSSELCLKVGFRRA